MRSCRARRACPAGNTRPQTPEDGRAASAAARSRGVARGCARTNAHELVEQSDVRSAELVDLCRACGRPRAPRWNAATTSPMQTGANARLRARERQTQRKRAGASRSGSRSSRRRRRSRTGGRSSRRGRGPASPRARRARRGPCLEVVARAAVGVRLERAHVQEPVTPAGAGRLDELCHELRRARASNPAPPWPALVQDADEVHHRLAGREQRGEPRSSCTFAATSSTCGETGSARPRARLRVGTRTT